MTGWAFLCNPYTRCSAPPAGVQENGVAQQVRQLFQEARMGPCMGGLLERERFNAGLRDLAAEHFGSLMSPQPRPRVC